MLFLSLPFPEAEVLFFAPEVKFLSSCPKENPRHPISTWLEECDGEDASVRLLVDSYPKSVVYSYHCQLGGGIENYSSIFFLMFKGPIWSKPDNFPWSCKLQPWFHFILYRRMVFAYQREENEGDFPISRCSTILDKFGLLLPGSPLGQSSNESFHQFEIKSSEH